MVPSLRAPLIASFLVMKREPLLVLPKQDKDILKLPMEAQFSLDEVGELPLTSQVRLLRILENGEFIKVGSSKVQKTNVRIIAATNVNMSDAIRKNKFREDLYYRLKYC